MGNLKGLGEWEKETPGFSGRLGKTTGNSFRGGIYTDAT